MMSRRSNLKMLAASMLVTSLALNGLLQPDNDERGVQPPLTNQSDRQDKPADTSS
ncbi:hypothetical protein ACFO9Q_14510 [Paenibacillus sp. GCM10023252]|uniref:hypothetical protein n=1 Tax=Paenibacillus sp. GCM10023252 TaxID=3252649 RepID=UPI00361D1F8A